MRSEVLVLGAGPAGAVVARRLAAAGVRVVLVGAAQRPGLEGVSARSAALLAEEGIESGAALLEGPLPRRGRWGGGDVEGREWIVERGKLAAALRARAVGAGVEMRPVAATRVLRAGGLFRVSTRDGDTLTAPVLIEARGRRGPARRGPLLLAFAQRFRRRRAAGSETRIEPADFGWCWWVEHRDTVWVQIVGQPRGTRPDGWLAAAARQIPALARVLEDAQPEGEPCACAAHARLGLPGMHGAPAADLRSWRVGDAAAALDPLSGQGIYQALKSARMAATALLSVMRGGDAALAERFVIERDAWAFGESVRVAAEFYGLNRAEGAFWAKTAKAYEDLAGAGVRVDPAPRIERRPVLLDERIVEREVVVSGAHPRGVWQVAGVPVAELVRHLDANAGATLESAARCLGRPDRAVAAAMHWLNQAGRSEGGTRPGNHRGG